MFSQDYSFQYATVEILTPMVRRVVARNPSPFTFYGTGTFIIGHGDVAIIDPGPEIAEHIETLLHALRNETVTHLLVTHTHLDHSPACRTVKAATGATTFGYGPHGSGRYQRGETVEEGADWEFIPDVAIRHGDIIDGKGWTFECVFTPGHTSNHICFHLCEEGALFTGDHVMGWSSTIVSPPDGDMGLYLNSLHGLRYRDDASYWPTHGPQVTDTRRLINGLIGHRLRRREQVLCAVRDGTRRIQDLVPKIYIELPTAMHPAAARSVYSTLIWLAQEERIEVIGGSGIDAEFVPINQGGG
ncbi:MAG: MBL fold metallo-hydrolase [Gammaproteobacteria bacterium]|nr:MBL fold metallo-hydrolase [Gammaproteobacteria bacterium]MDH3466651.1 MBL fold metallo-hydrolase [Gammaproteobacteria bacterium]